MTEGFSNARQSADVGLVQDVALMIQVLPAGHDHTDVCLTWLVDGATGPADVDVERLVWLWDETTLQDVRIIERNALGVRSAAYEPGPYSALETWTADFVTNYLGAMTAELEARLAAEP